MVDALRDVLDRSQGMTNTLEPDYLTQLVEFSIDKICSSEPQRLARESRSLLSSIQGLSKKSHQLIVDSTTNHAVLRQNIADFAQIASTLRSDVPRLALAADDFSTMFNKAGENQILTRRKQALRLLQNAERLVNIMELSPLLKSAVKTNPVNYSSTLDLYAHARRLASLYPSSPLVVSILSDADASIRQIATDLVLTLRSPSLKLAAGLRTVGWLKRLVLDLGTDFSAEETLPAVFLVCRLATLMTTLTALEPLRQLADQERLRRASFSGVGSGGQQTERYLKRYIEIFREHAFSMVSMSNSVDVGFSPSATAKTDALGPPPSPLSIFPVHLVGLLLDALRTYFPVITDRASRDSIVTQVLYCAGSLGRLGADFSVVLAEVGVNEQADQIKRHRLLAGRLDTITRTRAN
ncbi:hypothetical protein L249_4237 [Ophiocordyceps polyrhachis-furcata BCC 54312]|uniref:Conserved oligomeric Golgi complex subunit 8 n=1 Tax=Ophiocordyceps polyrhachis-furcata BCC 54312 TaxID=1330021 RepID=A0A367L8W2_9HYPO|nr:hypothetical protein L249_4237 [Ophiocordyceps polyrhachis-furcata BCC 54312]